MNKKNRYELSDLISDACNSLVDDCKEIKEGNYDLDDTIHEIADNSVPIYYYDIGRYAGNDSWLMTEKPEICPEGNAHDQIQANIYLAIVEGLNEHVAEKESKEL